MRDSIVMWLVIAFIIVVMAFVMAMGHFHVNTGPTPPPVGLLKGWI